MILQRRAFARRCVGLSVALPALAALPLPAGAAPAGADALAPMVVFDAAYVPALASTNAAGASPAAAQKASAAVRSLRGRWPQLKSALAAQPPSPAQRAAWMRALDRVGQRIDQADRLAGRPDWPGAHEVLEHVRIELMAVRRAAGFEYHVDRLTAFHEQMETIAQAGAGWKPAELTPARRADLERSFAQAAALWREVERHPADPAAYRLSPAREAQWRKGLADESAALTRLSDALRAGDAATLLKAAAAIKPPYARAFTAFGAAEGETVAL
jgi:hypothetical protein